MIRHGKVVCRRNLWTSRHVVPETPPLSQQERGMESIQDIINVVVFNYTL